MKIAIMLRHFKEHGGGVHVYTKNLLQGICSHTRNHKIYLLYSDPSLVGTYSGFDGVYEIGMRAPNKLIWDQVTMKWLEAKIKPDVVFNPKYSIPLLSSCKTVFVCHGLDWYYEPKWSPYLDRLNHKYLFPRFARKADAIISVSDTTTKHLLHYLKIPASKIHRVYLGVDKMFEYPISQSRLHAIRKKYNLPSRFLLFVGQIYPPKNFARLIRAFSQVGPELGIHLVVAGKHTFLCAEDIALIDKLGVQKWVSWPGWIEHDELPAIYRMADALVMPSLYEACPGPLLEAMQGRCPIMTSNRFGTKEIASDGAVFVDPEDVESIASGIMRVVTDPEKREKIIENGQNRAKEFSWGKCVQQTWEVLESFS